MMRTAMAAVQTPGGVHPLLLINPASIRRKDEMEQGELIDFLLYKEWEKTSRRAPFAQPQSSGRFSFHLFRKAGETLSSLMQGSSDISLKDMTEEPPCQQED